MSKEKNVFISHHNVDEKHIQNLKNLISGKGYSLKNSSIDSTKSNQANNSDYIKRLLRLRIQWAGKFVVLIGKNTHTRDWVNWEIEQAHKKGKKIIGIYLNGLNEKVKLPEKLDKYGHEVIPWYSEKIIGALENDNRTPEWCDPDGSPRQSPWKKNTSDC
ncbi:TIR domain-containing protein [Psychroserpens algicola]|uniref:TIR domain-containing protein n=1 Tax=Psychroserpens algicola TaxID=1719034 RepID=A0ABT0H3W9_9FLAO|nr:TIR domain-containing protein [Psychroserpens algicola]MCK8479070.1 TIR domain-containing protein [Psychroserpens algicola]